MGDYVPLAPINDEAREHNENLPGMGGVFNIVNLHTYHYAGNNPVKLIDPNGREFVTSETTKEEFYRDNFVDDIQAGLSLWDKKWDEMQTYFAENPDGVFYRAPGELNYQQYENRTSVNVVDPNLAVFDMMLIAGVGSLLRSGISNIPRVASSLRSQHVARQTAKQAEALYSLCASGNAPAAQGIIARLGGTEGGREAIRNLNTTFRAMQQRTSNNVEASIVGGLVRFTGFWMK